MLEIKKAANESLIQLVSGGDAILTHYKIPSNGSLLHRKNMLVLGAGILAGFLVGVMAMWAMLLVNYVMIATSYS